MPAHCSFHWFSAKQNHSLAVAYLGKVKAQITPVKHNACQSHPVVSSVAMGAKHVAMHKHTVYLPYPQCLIASNENLLLNITFCAGQNDTLFTKAHEGSSVPSRRTVSHRATCRESLAQTNLHTASCPKQLAQSQLYGHLHIAILRRTICNLLRATCAEQLAQSYLQSR